MKGLRKELIYGPGACRLSEVHSQNSMFLALSFLVQEPRTLNSAPESKVNFTVSTDMSITFLCFFRVGSSYSCTSLCLTAKWRARPRCGHEFSTPWPPPTPRNSIMNGRSQELRPSSPTSAPRFQKAIVREEETFLQPSFSHLHLFQRWALSPDRRRPHRRLHCP